MSSPHFIISGEKLKEIKDCLVSVLDYNHPQIKRALSMLETLSPEPDPEAELKSIPEHTWAELVEMFGDKAQRVIEILGLAGDPDKKLELFNELLGGHGVEALQSEHVWVSHYWQNTMALYVNMGDTYIQTVLYDTEANRFYWISWGDFYEGSEAYQRALELDC